MGNDMVGAAGDACDPAVKICSPLNKAFDDYRIASITSPCIDAGNMQAGSNNIGRGSSTAGDLGDLDIGFFVDIGASSV